MNKISISAFRWAPPFAQGLVRDIRLRWALEEVGLGYDVDLIEFGAHKSDAFRARQPFGQIPTLESDGVELFESGAILYALGLEHEKLMPADKAGRIDTVKWMFAALNTVEPPLATLGSADLVEQDPEWQRQFRAAQVAKVEARLADLDRCLAGRDYLTGRFTVADILMATTLRLIRHTDIVAGFPGLSAYLARCEARPAFQAALASQLRNFADNEPVAA